MNLSRRTFLKRTLALGALSAAGGAGYGWLESQQLTIEQVSISVNRLHPDLHGFKIVQLADFHLYPFTQRELVQQAVTLTNTLEPDIVCLVGDFVYHEAEAIFDLAPLLAQLNPKYGIYAVFGNHDLWTNQDVIEHGMREAGLTIMKNEGALLTVGAAAIYIAGLEDGWRGQMISPISWWKTLPENWQGYPDLNLALDSLPDEVPCVLLMHEPDLADTYSLDGRVTLQLSGHTHGGQVRLPGVGAVILPDMGRKYDQGLYKINNMWLYTTRGVGTSALPVRLNCPPEITELTLHPTTL